MNFEQLVNDVLLDFFEYLPSVELLRSFSHLNYRFNSLLISHFRTHDLNMQSISKDNFDIICREHLPFIAPYLNGLRLSDDDDTPNQINNLFSYSFSLNRFIQLKSLTLYHISSNEMLKQIVVQFNCDSHLIRFNIINCHVTFDRKILRYILNCICNLPKLMFCHLDMHLSSRGNFCLPSIRSKSIESLWIKNMTFDSSALIRLFRCTPNLRYLTTSVDKLPNNTQFPSILSSISSIDLIVDHLTNGSVNLLQQMPNLTSLTLQLGKPYMNGHQWKQFILDYLPKLMTFRFLMFFSLNNEEEINELIDTYRTPFWLIDHQWFIRCHWGLHSGKITTYIYTLPYVFSFFSFIPDITNICTISTCPRKEDYCTYNRVTTLLASNDSLVYNIHFNNIRHLELTFPVSDHFLTALPHFDRLISLTASSDSDADVEIVLYQLQMLINRALRLYLLTISHWNSSMIQHVPSYLTSNSIRRLDLISGHYLKRNYCFNSEQCTTFLRSSLAKQCHVLEIVINDRSNIEKLINGMDNLQALKVIIQPDQEDNYHSSREDLIRWMSSGFSRTFTENLTGTETIRLWVH